MAQQLINFDLDGTLVDGETLGNQAFIYLLPTLLDTVEMMVERSATAMGFAAERCVVVEDSPAGLAAAAAAGMHALHFAPRMPAVKGLFSSMVERASLLQTMTGPSDSAM